MQLCCLLNTFATKKIFPHIVTIHLKMLLPFARLFLKIFGVLNDQKEMVNLYQSSLPQLGTVTQGFSSSAKVINKDKFSPS